MARLKRVLHPASVVLRVPQKVLGALFVTLIPCSEYALLVKEPPGSE